MAYKYGGKQLNSKLHDRFFGEPSNSSRNNPKNGTNDVATEETVPKKHNNSFQGEKRNLGGGRTQAYQSYLDSVAQNKAKVKLNRRAGLSGLAVAVGQQFVDPNSTVGEMLNSDTLTYASYGAMIGAATPFAPVTAIVGGAIGGAIGFAKDVMDGDVSRWSKATWGALNHTYSPSSGSGQTPGSSGYKAPLLPPSTPSYGTISPITGVITKTPQFSTQPSIQPVQAPSMAAPVVPVSAADVQQQTDAVADANNAMVDTLADISKKLDTKED